MDMLTKVSRTSSLSEIIKTHADKDTIFNDYVSQKEIGKNIFKELHKRLRDIDEVKMGFVMDDTSDDIGILSQCQSLQALVSLAADYGLDFNDTNIIPGQKGSIRQIMDAVIEDVIPRIQVKDDAGRVTGYFFDASPYDTEHYSVKYSNVDAITWALPSFFLILQYHASIHEVCKWEDELIHIIKYGLEYIRDAFIEDEGQTGGGLATGWNFTKDCEEPSLYFTFAVCECYIDMHNTFRDLLSYLEAERNQRTYGILVDPELRAHFEEKQKDYEANLNKKTHHALEARFDEYNELVRLYRRINDLSEQEELRIDGTRYGDVEKKCRAVAAKVWSYVQKDLADKFFYNDLQTTLTEDDLRMSTTSDAMFNTVYIINIMIDAGLDVTLRLQQESAVLKNLTDEAEQLQREYDNLLESCQLAVQKAFRTYESLKSDSKEYIVDQFLIGFNENFRTHKNLVGELRKLRMRTFSLLPMLIHTNNVISEYLVKYPQHNMRKYLEYILDNRYVAKDGSKRWIWESDGFFSGSNYYYISALNEFFAYHNAYEKKYIAFGKKNADREESIRAAHLQSLRAPDGAIGKLEAEKKDQDALLEQKDEEIARLKKALEDFDTPVENAVRDVVTAELEARFATMLADTFAHAARVVTIPQVDDTADDGEGTYARLIRGMCDMLLSAALADYYSAPGRRKSPEEYPELRKKTATDVAGVVGSYLNSVKNATDGESKLKKELDKE